MKPEHQDLLADFADQAGPAEGQAAAALGALQARIDAGELGPTLPPAPPVPPPVAESTGLAAAGKVGFGLAALGLAGALAWWATHGDASSQGERGAPTVVATAQPAAPTPKLVGAGAPAAVPLVVQPKAPAPAQPTPSAKATPTPTKSRSRAADDKRPANDAGLGPEMELMSAARLAIGRGESRRALELLDDHKRRFRTGAFAKEREVSRVTAYCALGKTREALRVAKAFVKANPGSVLSDRLRQSCAAQGLADAALEK